uniref:Uncharacterized protein n=1 Tax=Cacopsylla melanoneura TaxID=428564 RepID=A0A8D8WVL3_9HEMI
MKEIHVSTEFPSEGKLPSVVKSKFNSFPAMDTTRVVRVQFPPKSYNLSCASARVVPVPDLCSNMCSLSLGVATICSSVIAVFFCAIKTACVLRIPLLYPFPLL